MGFFGFCLFGGCLFGSANDCSTSPRGLTNNKEAIGCFGGTFSNCTVLATVPLSMPCGGGFHQECSQPYSPVAKWMEDADVTLNDEGQQYGNLDEASAVARTPRQCLVIWCGDHKQRPGRSKLMFYYDRFRKTYIHKCRENVMIGALVFSLCRFMEQTLLMTFQTS